MTRKQPNSDQSGRATRRRQEKEVERAQRTVARAEQQAAPGQIQVSTKDLLAKIGQLNLELDFWKQRCALLDAHLNKVLGVPEVPQAEGPAEPTEEELTGEAPEAAPPDDKELE